MQMADKRFNHSFSKSLEYIQLIKVTIWNHQDELSELTQLNLINLVFYILL